MDAQVNLYFIQITIERVNTEFRDRNIPHGCVFILSRFLRDTGDDIVEEDESYF